MNSWFRRAGFGLLVVVLLQLAACTSTAAPGRLTVDSAWLRASVPGASVGAGYAILRNTGGSALSVVAVETDAASSTMIHTMADDHGVMKMREQGTLEIPAGGTVELAPGGAHLMLMGLRQPLVAGQRAAVDFTLADGQKLQVQMPVRDSAE